ncbi:kynurenine 3-monooxygenase, mitochondrial precursor [Tilletia horrida]|nr:kynurenine 3-monooxygenase, mitochondrial precursor [Tilletia horrida]
MSNALLALLYSSASTASASAAAPIASPPAPPAPTTAPTNDQPPAPPADAQAPAPEARTASSGSGSGTSSAPLATSPSAALSASNSLLALLTPPSAPAPAMVPPPPPPPTAQQQGQSSAAQRPATNVFDTLFPPPQQSHTSASPSLLDAFLRPAAAATPPVAASTPPPPPGPAPQQPPPPPSEPTTANDLLAALLNPLSSASALRTPPVPPAAPASATSPAAALEPASPTPLNAPSSGQTMPSLLQTLISPILSTPAPVQAAPEPVKASHTPDPAPAPIAPPAATPQDVAKEQSEAPHEIPAPASDDVPAARDTAASAPAPEAKATPPPDQEPESAPLIKSSLPAYVAPGSSHNRLPVQRAEHQVTKLTTTSGVSLADTRTSGLSLLNASGKQNQFHLDMTRLQPAGPETLHHKILQAIGIALLPQAQAQPQAPDTPAAPAAPVGLSKNLVATLPSPLPTSAESLQALETAHLGSIVLYTLSRARVRAVHRETGARTMLSPPPNSSFTLSANAKIIRLVSGVSSNAAAAGNAENEKLLVVAAIIQDGLRAEEGGEEGERVEFYLCAWGLRLDFGRQPSPTVSADTSVRVLVFASLPASNDVDGDAEAAALDANSLPSLLWESTPPSDAGVGPYGSLLLRESGEDAQLWRVDVDRCECRTGFGLEGLQKGKGAVRLGYVASHSVFADRTNADAPALIALIGAGDAPEVHLTYAHATRTDTLALSLELPTSQVPRSESTEISFFGTLSDKTGQGVTVAVIGLNGNTEVLVVRLPGQAALTGHQDLKHLQRAELLASWRFDAPKNDTDSAAANLLHLESEHTQTLVLTQPQRASVFLLPLKWATRADATDSVPALRWTECAMTEPLNDFVVDAMSGSDGGEAAPLALTASYTGGVHIVQIPAAIVSRRAASGADQAEAVADVPVSAETAAAPKGPADVAKAASSTTSTPPQPASAPEVGKVPEVNEVKTVEASAPEEKKAESTPSLPTPSAPAVVIALPAAVAAASASEALKGPETPVPEAVPASAAAQSPALPSVAPPAASTPQRASTPAKGRAAKIAASEAPKTQKDAASSRSRTSSQVRKEDASTANSKAAVPSAVNGTGAVAPSVDLGPVMSLLKQQIGQVVIPDVKASTRQAVQEYMGSTLPEAVLAALPHELHRLMLRPDLSAHLMRTIASGILPNVQRTAVDTVTRVLAPEFEEIFRGLEDKVLSAVESEMVNLRKDVVAEQGEAMVQTEGLVKEMSARMAELRSAVLGLNAANARMEKILVRMVERDERREALHAEERNKLLEVVDFQQRKMESLEASFGQQVEQLQTTLEEHRAEIRTLLEQRPRRSEEWRGGSSGYGRQYSLSHVGPSPPPLPGHAMAQAPYGPEWMGRHHDPGAFMHGSAPPPPPPPPPPSSGLSEAYFGSATPMPQPPPPLTPHRNVPERVEEALIQALGAPGIEQDSTPLRETLHTLYARFEDIREALGSSQVSAPAAGQDAEERVSQPVMLALAHRLAMALDARARLGPNPPVSLVLAGTGGAMEVTQAVSWLEAVVPLLAPWDPRIERQYQAVVVLMREALWRAVQGLKGGPDGWWDEKRAKDHTLAYLRLTTR